MTLHALASIAVKQASLELEAFVSRLANALFVSSEEALPAAGSDVALRAFHHLHKNRALFQRLVSECLGESLRREIDSFLIQSTTRPEPDALDLSLVSFDAMEIKVLTDKLGHAIESRHSAPLDALGIRLAGLLHMEELPAARNPFRPSVFVQAIADAWNRFDITDASQRMVLRHLSPEVFLRIEPVWQALNEALIAQGILPDLALAYRKARKHKRRNGPLHDRLQRWLAADFPAVHGASAEEAGSRGAALSAYLGKLQASATAAGNPPADAGLLRAVKVNAPAGMLSRADEQAMELLARMLEQLFQDRSISGRMKEVLAGLQIPLLKAALADREFFFNDEHPARRLIDAIAGADMLLGQQTEKDDSLLKIVERIVDRVQQEYGEQIALFDAAALDLEAFIERERQPAAAALSQAIEEASRREKIAHAEEQAARDVAARIETGEVAGFVESFLESQWTRILALAYSVRDTRPEALQNALDTMDDLIWSIQPKTSPEARRELVSRLPSMLALLNAWLNVMKWDGPERVAFFSTLAERHAALVRVPLERNPRHQLEISMNVAQKASEHRLSKRLTERQERKDDRFARLVDGLDPGSWIEFLQAGGATVAFRLEWVSPGRTRFVFAGRGGRAPLALTAGQLARSFRDSQAMLLAGADSPVDRALAATLEQMHAA